MIRLERISGLRFQMFTFCVALLLSHQVKAQSGHEGHESMPPAQQATLIPTGTLRLQAGPQTATLSVADFHNLPHTTVKMAKEHTKEEESYSGVPLATLLEKVGLPQADRLHGKVLANYLVVEAADHYRVVLSLAEVTPGFHPGEVILADSLDGKPIDKDGPFKLVVSEDKHPSRWVRNVVAIYLMEAQIPGN